MGLMRTIESSTGEVPWSELAKLIVDKPKADVIVTCHGGRMPKITKIVDDGSAIFVTITN